MTVSTTSFKSRSRVLARPDGGGPCRFGSVSLGGITGVLVLGFLVGGLARFAVPGPDPMPIWKTIALGVVGSFLGGGAGYAFAGGTGAFAGSVLAATLLLLAYRRFVQRRPITGPRAREPAMRPRRLRDVVRGTTGAGASAGNRPLEQLKTLAELRDSGALSVEEFERKKAELLKRV